jgi:hypothetical protein|tara:strand:- start:55 stop:537 length:483 start_codon:yes stop_codon:yes gene_type:complete
MITMNFLIHINGKNARHIAYIIEHLMEVEAANTLAIRDALLSKTSTIHERKLSGLLTTSPCFMRCGFQKSTSTFGAHKLVKWKLDLNGIIKKYASVFSKRERYQFILDSHDMQIKPISDYYTKGELLIPLSNYEEITDYKNKLERERWTRNTRKIDEATI